MDHRRRGVSRPTTASRPGVPPVFAIRLQIRGTVQTTTPTNAAPTVANVIPDQTATAGSDFSYTFPTNTFNDTDTGDTLIYTANEGVTTRRCRHGWASTPTRGPSRARRRLRMWRRW